jgi:hypothetical protein
MSLTTFTGPVVSQNGFIDSSFTDAERDAIVDPQPGLLIYNTTSNTYQVCTVGGGTPTWDTAFGGGGGGGGGGGFPYVFSSLSVPTSPWGQGSKRAMPVLFSPNGLQATTVGTSMGIIVNVATLANPFDVYSSTSSVSLPEQYVGMWSGIGSFFNANGSQYTYLATDTSGSNTIYYAKYNLNTNYDMTTANYVGYDTLGTLGFGMGGVVTSACLSPDGTKIIFGGSSNMMFTSSIAERPLSTPYQIDTVQLIGTTQNVTSLIQNYAGPNALLFGLAFNPAGTVAYISTIAYGAPSVLEFKLGTAYDLNSQSQAYTASFQPPGTMSPTFQSYNWGLTVVGNSEKLVIGYAEFGQPYYSTATLAAVTVPNITGVSPSSGAVASSVTITGTGFTGTTNVLFDGLSATYTVNSNTQITAAVPAGSGTVDVQVFNPAGTSTEVNAFTYTAPTTTTYSAGTDYSGSPGSGSGLNFNDNSPGTPFLNLQSFNWFNTDYTTLYAQGPGTVYTLDLGGGLTGTFTTSGNWNIYSGGASVSGSTTLTGAYGVQSITFTPQPVTFVESSDYVPIYLDPNATSLALGNTSQLLGNNCNNNAAAGRNLTLNFGNIGQTFSTTATSSSTGGGGPNSATISFSPAYTGGGGYITSFTLN